jgi:hypothetical protein
MRDAVYGVVAAPLEHNVEDLERKLIALRAEIDAILSLLARQKVAAPAIELEPTSEPQVTAEAIEPAPAATVRSNPHMPEQDEVATDPSLPDEDIHPLAGPAPMHAIASDQPSDVALPPEATQELPVTDTSASNDVAPIDAVDHPRLVADTPLRAAAEAMEQAAPAGSVPAAAERTADALPAPATVTSEAPAAAQVISLQPRKLKMNPAASAPARPRRRLATKIAASIIALLAAATILILADEEAIGSDQSLPWMSPLPSHSGAGWPFLGDRRSFGQEVAADDSSTSPARATSEDALLSRYREAWPIGW